jgi:hypothetical protein
MRNKNQEPKKDRKLPFSRVLGVGAVAAAGMLGTACGSDKEPVAAPSTTAVIVEQGEVVDQDRLYLGELGKDTISRMMGILGEEGSGGQHYPNGNFGNKPALMAGSTAPEIYYTRDGDVLKFDITQCAPDPDSGCAGLVVTALAPQGRFGTGTVAPKPEDLLPELGSLEITGIAAQQTGGEYGFHNYAVDMGEGSEVTIDESIRPINPHNTLEFAEMFGSVRDRAFVNND